MYNLISGKKSKHLIINLVMYYFLINNNCINYYDINILLNTKYYKSFVKFQLPKLKILGNSHFFLVINSKSK